MFSVSPPVAWNAIVHRRSFTTSKGSVMKKFLFLHYGFERPTPEIMQTWQNWFASFADRQLDQGGFAGGVEISKTGLKKLGWDADALTGYNVIEAESLEAAEKIARACPFISAIRVYELR